MRPTLFGLATALTLASRAQALQPLDHFLERARAHALDTREAAEASRVKREESARAWQALLPSATLRASYTRNQYPASSIVPPNAATGAPGRTITILPEDQLDAFAIVDLPLVDVARWSLASAAKHAERASHDRAAQTALDVDKQVARAYFTVVAADALTRAAESSLAVARENHALVAERQRVGLATELDLRRAAAEVEHALQAIADARYTVVVTRRSLETLAGVAAEPGAIALADDLRPEAPAASFEDRAPRTPGVSAASREVDAAHANVSAAWGALTPSVSANFTERLTNATGFAGQSQVYAASVTATWHLEVGAWSGVRSLEAAEAVAAVRRERTERAARDLVVQAWAQVEAGIVKARAARAQLEATAETARLAHERYAQGRATQLEVVQADRDTFAAEVARIQADADLAYARQLLRSAAGEPLVTTHASKEAP
jgi:outer membrane protein TolC